MKNCNIATKITYLYSFGHVMLDQLGPQPFDDEISDHVQFLHIQSIFDQLTTIVLCFA